MFLGISLVSCAKSECKIETTIPDCIQKIIENTHTSEDLKTVTTQEVDDGIDYWMNTDFTHFDGVEYILNSKCDTICFFCGACLPAKCSENYNDDWRIIWER